MQNIWYTHTMGKRRSLSKEQRSQIVALREIGNLKYRDIASKMKVSLCAVHNALQIKNTTGGYDDRKRCGRPRLSTERQNRRLVRLATTHRKASSHQLAELWKESGGPSASKTTVKRVLYSKGMHGRIARKRPYLSELHRKRRLQFALTYQHWTAKDWARVIWSDESKFVLSGNDSGKVRIWRKKGEEMKRECLQETVKFGGGSIMVWGCMSSAGVGLLERVDGIMNAEKYVDILRRGLLPSVPGRFPGKLQYIFQQDNDPKHTSKRATEWIKENVPSVLPWPALSPDLNPIEHVWAEIKRRRRGIHAENVNELWDLIEHAWYTTFPDVCRKLVNSMPRRLAEVIKNKGGNTKY